MSCAVKTCKNVRRFRPPGISFHRLPIPGPWLNSWLRILKIRQDSYTWSRHKLVCSAHFDEKDFIIFGANNKRLRKMARPHLNMGSDGDKGASEYQVVEQETASEEEVVPSVVPEQHVDEFQPGGSEDDVVSHNVEHCSLLSGSVAPVDGQEARKKLEVEKDKGMKVRQRLYKAKTTITNLQRKITTLKTVLDDLRQTQSQSLSKSTCTFNH